MAEQLKTQASEHHHQSSHGVPGAFTQLFCSFLFSVSVERHGLGLTGAVATAVGGRGWAGAVARVGTATRDRTGLGIISTRGDGYACAHLDTGTTEKEGLDGDTKDRPGRGAYTHPTKQDTHGPPLNNTIIHIHRWEGI